MTRSNHHKTSDPFTGNNDKPRYGSSNLKTTGSGPITIVVKKIPTAIFLLLLPIAIQVQAALE